jgi:hypothetical protein
MVGFGFGLEDWVVTYVDTSDVHPHLLREALLQTGTGLVVLLELGFQDLYLPLG